MSNELRDAARYINNNYPRFSEALGPIAADELVATLFYEADNWDRDARIGCSKTLRYEPIRSFARNLLKGA